MPARSRSLRWRRIRLSHRSRRRGRTTSCRTPATRTTPATVVQTSVDLQRLHVDEPPSAVRVLTSWPHEAPAASSGSLASSILPALLDAIRTAISLMQSSGMPTAACAPAHARTRRWRGDRLQTARPTKGVTVRDLSRSQSASFLPVIRATRPTARTKSGRDVSSLSDRPSGPLRTLHNCGWRSISRR